MSLVLASNPQRILAIDSGADAGWALVEDRAVVACGFRAITLPDWRALTRIVIERPHTGRTKARKRDIITLAIRAGEAGGIAHYLSGVKPEYIEPNQWKGSMSKEVGHKLIQRKMTDAEHAVFATSCRKVAAGKQHNVLDAIGIALYAVKRL